MSHSFFNAGSSNGRTGAFEAPYLGSNPSPAGLETRTNFRLSQKGRIFVFGQIPIFTNRTIGGIIFSVERKR